MSLLVTKYILNSTELKSTQNIKLYHFGHAILSVPFCPIPFCPYTILSKPFCPYHFIRYHFVRSPLPADHPSFENLAMIADQRQNRSIVRNPYHVLRRFFLEKAPTGHNLRPRAHNFVLPIKDNNNFVPRILYNELLT